MILHQRLPDFRVQFLNLSFVILFHRALRKCSGQVFLGLRFPSRHLVRGHLVVRRDLRNRLLSPDRFQGHPRLKRRGMLSSRLPHESQSSGH
jgi:hypothetical protein